MVFVLTFTLPSTMLSRAAADSTQAASAPGSPAPTNQSVSSPVASPVGTPLPPGTVNSAFVPTVSSVAAPSMEPRLNRTTAGYTYVTAFGNYSFSNAAPYVMNYSSPQVSNLVSWSAFLIGASTPGLATPMLPTNATVVQADNYTLLVSYVPVYLGVPQGRALFRARFSAYAPPRFEVNFTQAKTYNVLFNILWVLAGTPNYVRTLRGSVVNLRSIGTDTWTASPNETATFGPSPTPSSWPWALRADWSDVGAGDLYAGPVWPFGSSLGQGLIVQFPVGRANIDPSLVAGTASSDATAYSSERKTFFYDGFYYAFYDYNGISAKSSPDGVTWTTVPGLSGTISPGTINSGFDVAQRGSEVAVGWIDSNLGALTVDTGTLNRGAVGWNAVTTVTTISGATSAGPVGLAIGTDGTVWIAADWGSGSSFSRHIFESWSPAATSFAQVQSASTGASSSVMDEPIVLPGGAIAIIDSEQGSSTIQWEYWSAGTWSGWGSYGTFLQTGGQYFAEVSSVALPNGWILVVFPATYGTSPQQYSVDFLTILPTSTSYGSVAGPSSSTSYSYPTVGADSFGNVYVYWFQYDGSANTIQLLTWPRTWAGITFNGGQSVIGVYTFPAGSVGVPWITAAAVDTTEAFAIFEQLASNGAVTVQFLGAPLATGLGATPSQPWNRDGLSPYGTYFQQLSDYVAPGNGLLSIVQTDLDIPGRGGLDLVLSRVYTTPRVFLNSGGTLTPYLYEPTTLPYRGDPTNLGLGWQLNLPWIGSNYLHFLNGRTYIIQWGALDVFVNHVGDQFTLRQYSSAHLWVLIIADGTNYTFDTSTGRLTSVKDPTGQNSLSFSYTGPNGLLGTITDTVGRVASFGYNGNGQLQSITYGGRSVQYSYDGTGRLAKVLDSLGRATQFSYNSTNPWLVAGVTYPTGGRTAYSYRAGSTGEATSYLVSLQNVYNGTALAKSTSFSYDFVNGRVAYAKVLVSNGTAVQGYTAYNFNSPSTGMTSTVFDPSGRQLRKVVTWYTANGLATQTDTYNGNAIAKTSSAFEALDDWGNVIYTRDAVGQETFASYANTDHANVFGASGALSLTSSGRIMSSNFDNHSLSDWSLHYAGGSAGWVGLNLSADPSSAPSVAIWSNQTTSTVSSARRYFPAQSGTFVAEGRVRAAANSGQIFFLLMNATGANSVYFALLDGYGGGGQFGWSTDGYTYTSCGSYVSNAWYLIAFEVNVPAGTYNVWINGNEACAGASLRNRGPITNMIVQAGYVGDVAPVQTWGDDFRVYTTGTIMVTGMPYGTEVEAIDATSGAVVSATMPVNLPSILLFNNLAVNSRNYFLRVYNTTQAVQDGSFEPGGGWTYATNASGSTTWGSGSVYHTGYASYLLGFIGSFSHGNYAEIKQDVNGFRSGDTLRMWFKLSPYTGNGGCSGASPGFVTVRLSTTAYGSDANPVDISLATIMVSTGSQAVSTAWTQLQGTVALTSFRLHARIVSANDFTSCQLAFYFDDIDAGPEYTSPTTDFVGGDNYAYAFPSWRSGEFYPGSVPATIHNRAIGTLSWQNGSMDPVLYYDMSTTQTPSRGDILKDISGHGNAGVFSGTTSTPGIAGNARSFNGASDYIWVPESTTLDPATFSVSFWIWPSSPFPTSYTRIIGKDNYGTNGIYRGWMVLYDGTQAGKVYMAVFANSPSFLETDTPRVQLTAGAWQQLTFTFDGAYLHAYLNGVEQGTPNAMQGTFGVSPGLLYIGTGDNSGYFKGSLDEVRFYPRALSAAEVAAQATQVLWLDMETTTSSGALVDMSGYQNAGTVYGATSAVGKVGHALSFVGNSSNYVWVSDSPSLDFPQFTVSAWLYPTWFPANWNRIISHDYWTSASKLGWTILYNANAPLGRVYIAVFTGGSGESDSQQVQLVANAWNHVVFTFSGSSICAYLNGVLVGASCTAMSGTYAPATGYGFYAGGGDNSYFTGSVDEVRAFDRSLSSSDVLSLDAPASTPPSRTFSLYNAQGKPVESRTYHNASWAYTEQAFDPYGNQIYQSNPDGQTTYTAFSSQSLYAYPTSVVRSLGPLDDMDTSSTWTTVVSTPSQDAGYFSGGYSTAQYTSPPHSLYVYVSGGIQGYDYGSTVNYKDYSGARVTDLRVSSYLDRYSHDGSSFDSMDAGIRMRLYNSAGTNYATYEYWLAAWRNSTNSNNPPWNARLVNGKPPMNGWLVFDANPNNDWTNISWASATKVRIELFVSAAGTYNDAFRMYFDDVGVNVPSLTTSTSYDFGTGLRLSQTDPRGFTTAYTYDLLGRVTSITLPQVGGVAPVAKYAYDDTNNVVTVYDPDSMPRILHFDMETQYNGKMEDLSGYGDSGTITGTTSVGGRVGLARRFNGVSDNILSPNSAILSSNYVTVSFWANWTALPPGDGSCGSGSSSAPVITDGNYLGPWWFELRHDGTMDFYVTTSTGARAAGVFAAQAAGSWHHYVGTYDGSYIRIYKDGVLVGSPVALSGVLQTPTNGISIGKGFGTGCGGKYTNGTIDEVQIFSQALNASVVASIYGGTQGGRYVKTYYDGLGREIRAVQRSFYSGPSMSTYHQETYVNNWQDQVAMYVNANGSATRTAYDFLRRPTVVTNPDGTTRTATYDDVNRIVTMMDEVGRETQNMYDVGGRLVGVRQYTSTYGYIFTTYSYDQAGDLLAVTDALGQTTRHVYDDLRRPVQTLFPDGASESYTYDTLGNLVAKTDRGGRVIRYVYDRANRLVKTTYPGGAAASFGYDADGNTISVLNGTASVWFTYDPLDRLSNRSVLISGDSTNYTSRYTYDLAGNLIGLTYPDSQGALAYTYDPFYRVASMVFGSTTVATFTYRKDDLPSTISYGDGTLTTYVFNGRGFPLEIKVTKGSTRLMDLVYTENAAGDVTGLTNNAVNGDTERYGYDNLDRLTSATGPWGSLSYTYDGAGNQLTMVLGTTTTYYAYGAYNELCASSTSTVSCSTPASKSVTKYTYDPNGNIVSRVSSATNTYTFDLENRLVTAVVGGSTYGFAYDGLGDRVRETGPSGHSSYTNTYVASGDEMLYLKSLVGTTTTKTVYLYANGLLIAGLSGTTYSYFHEDHLGSTRVVTQAGTSVFSTNYEPFGVQYGATGTDPNVKYTGQWSEALGLYWNHARFYDPSLGRFVSMDQVLGDLRFPQSLDRYAYTAGNPERYSDTSGRFLNILIGAIAGAILGGITCAAAHGWSWSNSCWVAVGAGAVAGAIAGATFGLATAAVAPIFAEGTIASAVVAGALSGAVSGLAGYEATGLLTIATGGTFHASYEGALEAAGIGALSGAVGAGLWSGGEHIYSDWMEENYVNPDWSEDFNVGPKAAKAFQETLERNWETVSPVSLASVESGFEQSPFLMGKELFQDISGDLTSKQVGRSLGWNPEEQAQTAPPTSQGSGSTSGVAAYASIPWYL